MSMTGFCTVDSKQNDEKRGELMNSDESAECPRAHFEYCGTELGQLSKIIFYSNTANLMNNNEGESNLDKQAYE